jgi:undecaprenyl pyrophosphate synthase
MDGNRRFARSHKIETVEGHNLGFEALARVSLRLLISEEYVLTRNVRSWRYATNPV